MKRVFIQLVFALCLVGSTSVTACKNKKAQTETNSGATSQDTSSPAPVEIATDESLTNGVRDATKDFPGVNAVVSNGEVTLTGTIKRDRLPKLMQSIHALQPKKVNNNLIVEQ